MDIARALKPGDGESVTIPGFGATFKLESKDGGSVAIVEHPFAVGTITAPHRHSREDEHSFVLEGQIGFSLPMTPRSCSAPAASSPSPAARCTPCGTPPTSPAASSRSSPRAASRATSESSASCSSPCGPRPGRRCTRRPIRRELASRYGLTYGNPEWLDDIVAATA
ncbi:hypothetical protein [Kutzneria kofuensis]|uniref:hypothetical protein n=1 Tax=Kutzneria kofuensis TaxID=103725 RepID=UPI0031ED0F4B